MIGVIGIILSLVLLMYLAYRGVTVLILAPVLALLAALMSGGSPLLPTYTEIYMREFANYAKTYFPLFLLGSIFGKVMEDSGSAKAIAHYVANKIGKQRAMLAIVISGAILTYGGVSLFVVAFALYPIAAALFKEAGIPKRLIPATIALSSFTFTMAALPGTAQIQNAIPMPFYGTNTYAGPILGIVAAIIMFSFGMWWITSRAKKAMAKGEGYGDHIENFAAFDDSTLPKFWVALIPILIVLILNFILTNVYFKHVDGSYLKFAPYNTSLSKVAGTWSLIISLIIAIITAIVVNRKRFASTLKTVNGGAMGSLLAVINTSSEVGYGNVVSSLAAFAIIKAAILGISHNPLISSAISVNLLAGMTGSASGGMSIALGALGKTYLDLAHQLGINPGALHRITVLACSGLDCLPHNGAVITLLGICGLTHKQSYKDIFMVCSVGTLFAVIAAVILANFGVV